MYNPWLDAAMLALESSNVVALRMMKVAAGGRAGQTEAQLMISEKMAAATEATMTLMMGGTLGTVIGRYREHVAANVDRLQAAT